MLKPHVPGECLNCGAPTSNNRSLYCGERCRQIAEIVRYSRRKVVEGTYERPDIFEAIISRLTILSAGEFYDKRGRAVSEKERRELMARANAHCENCGRAFEPEGDARFTVQHTATPEGWKLEAWCYRCNMNDRMGRVADAYLEGLRAGGSYEPSKFHIDFNERVHSPEPLLLCDDHENWPTIYKELQYPGARKRADKQRP